MSKEQPDIIIVGSGVSGVHAAQAALNAGARVTMLDFGRKSAYRDLKLPAMDFTALRLGDDNQHRYILGDDYEGIQFDDVREGNKLMPMRSHILADKPPSLPILSKTFVANESFAMGGLAQSWGAGTVPLRASDIKDYPLDIADLDPWYNEVCKEIGISGDHDDMASQFHPPAGMLPPLELNDQARKIFQSYKKKRKAFNNNGMIMGRTWLAVRTTDGNDGRNAYDYLDTEYWGDADKSVYRPVWTLEKLQKNACFTYQPDCFVKSYKESEDNVRLEATSLVDGSAMTYNTDRLILCAGTLGSPRIVLGSTKAYGVKLPVLTNPYSYVPCFHPASFGRQHKDRRCGFSQLSAICKSLDNPDRSTFSSIFSYRSLMTFRLLGEAPLPTRLALDAFRVLLPSLAIVTIFHEDHPHDGKKLYLDNGPDQRDVLKISYQYRDEELMQFSQDEKNVFRHIRRLGLVPLKNIHRKAGSSIHYAGSLPMSVQEKPFTTNPATGMLAGHKRVHISDGSVMPTMPCVLPTFTLMALARKTGVAVVQMERQKG